MNKSGKGGGGIRISLAVNVTDEQRDAIGRRLGDEHGPASRSEVVEFLLTALHARLIGLAA